MAINTIKATMQMRRGREEDFDPDQMTAGEWAVSTDAKYVRMCFAPGLCLRMATYEAFEEDMEEIQDILASCQDIQTAIEAWVKLAEQHADDAAASAASVEDMAHLSESWAVGGTGTRLGEDTDNSKYYSEQAKKEADRAAAIANFNIDSELSATSANPVQNKVITSALDSKGSVAYYKGTDESGTISGDLTKYGVTSSMTLKELYSKIPSYSAWEIYFNSHSNALNNSMPVATGGILHIYKNTSSRGMMHFFDYRTGNIYTTPVIDDTDFKWSLIGGGAFATNLSMYTHPSQINSSYTWENFDKSKMPRPAILCAVINNTDRGGAFASGIIPVNTVGTLVIFAPATRVSAIFIDSTTQTMYHASSNNITTENLTWVLSEGGFSQSEADELYAKKSIYDDTAISLGRIQNSTVGSRSIAYGTNNIAIGNGSDSFGNNNVSGDSYSFSEGCGNIALGYGSHAENCQNIAGAKYVFKIESYDTNNKKFTFDDTFYGFSNSFSALEVGSQLHIANTSFINDASIYTVSSIESDGKSVIVNENIPASNFSAIYATLIVSGDVNYSGCHAEGRETIAAGLRAHAEGYQTTASGANSHAEGYQTTASGTSSHAEGRETIAAGLRAHAEGYQTTASGTSSHAEGRYTYARNYQHVQGHYNDSSKTGDGVESGTSSGTAFCIGNGTSSALSNAVRIDYNGKLWCKDAYSSTGADYAELFEWEDGNIDNENRVGYFVTMKGKKIKKANRGDWILGIVSANPCVLGNSDMEWQGQFLRDEFGAFIIDHHEETIIETEIVEDEETGEPITQEVQKEIEYDFYRLNPDYDPNQEYTDRASRPEWDAVGMMGVLSVWDDGSCEVDGFCVCGDGGVATSSDNGYRVVERVTENIIKVVLK